jgi:exosortase family protein XrtF
VNWKSLSEFKPSLIFLAKFVGLYLSLNLLYGVFVSSYRPAADPVTRWVTDQTVVALELSNYENEAVHHTVKPTSTIRYKGQAILSVYEGCNGLNVVIIFISFLLAFGPYTKQLVWFIPMGIVVIHIFNLVRITGLFFLTIHRPEWIYFLHKYLFTAFIYLIVFILWFWWVKKFGETKHAKE